jgi:hypothetical protein
VHVFGSSSMGALRAAELADFGMQGIGAIFEAYSSGRLEDDDEVAVAHRSASEGFAPISEALVNMRATLEKAVRSNIIAQDTSGALEDFAKGRFYAERNYEALLRDGKSRGIDAEQLSALRAWLPDGRVDQKRADALELLTHLRSWVLDRPTPKRVTYSFHATDAWNEAVRLAMAAGDESDLTASEGHAGVVEELKIAGRHAATWQGAALRGVAIREAALAGVRPDMGAVQLAIERLRAALGLATPEQVTDWMSAQGLSEAEALRFFEDQARCGWSAPLMGELARRHLADHLRSTGEYAGLVNRADAKDRYFQTRGSRTPALAELSLGAGSLWAWYFKELLGRPVPSDLEQYARGTGFRDADELRSAVIREYEFSQRARED